MGSALIPGYPFSKGKTFLAGQRDAQPSRTCIWVINDTSWWPKTHRGTTQVDKSLHCKIIYKYEDKARSQGPWFGGGVRDRRNSIFSHQNYQLVCILPSLFHSRAGDPVLGLIFPQVVWNIPLSLKGLPILGIPFIAWPLATAFFSVASKHSQAFPNFKKLKRKSKEEKKFKSALSPAPF